MRIPLIVVFLCLTVSPALAREQPSDAVCALAARQKLTLVSAMRKGIRLNLRAEFLKALREIRLAEEHVVAARGNFDRNPLQAVSSFLDVIDALQCPTKA